MQLKVTVQMPQKTLSEWLSLLEVNHPTEIEFGLNRIARVAMELGFSSSEIDRLANSNIKEENRLYGGDGFKMFDPNLGAVSAMQTILFFYV